MCEHIARRKTSPLPQDSFCSIWHQQLRTTLKHVDGFHAYWHLPSLWNNFTNSRAPLHLLYHASYNLGSTSFMKFALSVFGYGIQPYLACSQGRVFLMLGLWNSILPKRNVWRLVEGTVVALDFSLLASLSCGLAAKYSFLFLKNRFTSTLKKTER